MIRILCFLILAVLCGVNGQRDCVPEAIEGLQLDVNGTLHWLPSTNCEDTSYLIYTVYQETVQHFFQVYETFLDVSFLPSCEFYRFVVVAVAFTDLSEEKHLDTTMPAQPGVNVTVSQMHVVPQGEDAVFLEWEMDQQFAHCVQYFRIVHWDGEGAPLDTYTTYSNVVLDNLAPCTQFEFTVTPIYNDEMEGGIGFVTFETPAHTAHVPTLESVRPGTTYIDMTWGLPPYRTNRCPITTIVVDGSPFVNLTIPITDSTTRPPVPIHVDSLLSDRMYFFRVTLVNTAGAATPIPIAIQTLPNN